MRLQNTFTLTLLYGFIFLAIPALWWGLTVDVPARNHWSFDAPWQQVVTFEPIAVWYTVMLLGFSQDWLQRNFFIRNAITFSVMRILTWSQVIGLPIVALLTAHHRWY